MLAWRKLERAFNHGDIWFDELVISAFEMNLVNNLQNISKELESGTYKLKPIQPIPFPKGGKDTDGNLKVRQSFFIDFRDQLVWVAVCNVIGRTFDIMMPAWSYGNRQYVSMWKDVEDGKKYWALGNHRNTTRNIYRTWTQSWPLMRKRITASLKKMARLGIDDFDDIDNQVSNDEEYLDEKHEFFKLQYLKEGYFPQLEDNKSIEVLYWTGLDLEQFFQKVKMEKVRSKIKSVLASNQEYDKRFEDLLNTITHFEIDYSDYLYENADKDLKEMQLSKNVPFEGLPTGLVVAGMLANIYMLDIDNQVVERLKTEKDIIHFRYVDDHVIVSTSEEKLFEWLAWYQQLLKNNGLVLNVSKLAPKDLLEGLIKKEEGNDDNLIISDYKDEIIENIRACATIDPKYPTPLMTQTLQKVSMLQGLNLNMLSTREFGMVFGELQSLLVSDLSEQEIKESTRISFACTMLTRLIVDGDVDYEKIYYFRRQWLEQVDCIKLDLYAKLSNITAHKEYDTKEKVDKVVDACTSIIFNDAQEMDLEKLKKACPNIHVDFKCLEQINEIIKNGHNTTKAKEKLVFNMLMYALDKVPDKVRIWIRVFDYCVRHEPSQIITLYKKLDSFKDYKLHRMSVDFLTALLNTLCADNIIKATARLVLNDYKIPSDADKDRSFIENVKLVNSSTSQHFFVQDSKYILSKAVAFFDMYDENKGIKEKGDGKSFFFQPTNYHGYNLDSTFWLLWAADLSKVRDQKDRPIFSCLLNANLNFAQMSSEYFRAYYFMYLREVSIISNKQMFLPDNFNASVTWLDSSAKYTITHMKNVKGLEKLQRDDKLTEFSSKSLNGKLSLVQWIEHVNAIDKSDVCFTIANSELVSVLILLSVINEIEKKGEDIHSIVIHPENFYLDEGIINNNWSYYISKIDKKELLDIIYEQMQNPELSPYDYPKYLNKSLSKNTSMSYGLGIIFLQLLSKRTILPWALNNEQVGFEWQYVLHELQGEGRISSVNYRILWACLSPRQRENIMLSQILGDSYVRESYRDNPEIHNWVQLKEELYVSLQQLRANLVSVAEEAHRQLTVIDLN